MDHYQDGSEAAELAPAEKRVSIVKIAEDLGIAPSSVSRALNGRSGVSVELQKRVRAHARKVGYIAHGHGAGEAGDGRQPLKIIAMIVGDIRNPFYADLIYYTQKDLVSRGYQLCIFCSDYEEAKEMEYLQMVDRFNFAGVIQMNVTTERISHILRGLKAPVVMLNRIIRSFESDYVLLDNYEAGYIATRHLMERGHSKIGFVLGQRESASCMQRYAGFQQAMENFGLEIEPAHILQGDLTLETGEALAGRFCALSERPSAMLVANDLSAHGFVNGCRKHGVHVPEDLSVISFDNIAFSSIGSVTLTSIDPSVEYMAKTAARLMVERIENPQKPTERIVIKPTLVERKSTAYYRGPR